MTPNAARESVIVGALERLPAMELTPTKIKDPTVPMIAAQVACQKEMPNPKKNEPYERARSETLPAAQGQKSDRAVPCRSPSEMKLVPWGSIEFRIFTGAF